MTTMVAKVMKAIDANRPMSDWPTVAELEKQARAAIKAMREPTPGVLAIVEAEHGFRDASIYRPFIDAALKESK